MFKDYMYRGKRLTVVAVSTLYRTGYIPLSINSENGFKRVGKRLFRMRSSREEAQAEMDAFARMKGLKPI